MTNYSLINSKVNNMAPYNYNWTVYNGDSSSTCSTINYGQWMPYAEVQRAATTSDKYRYTITYDYDYTLAADYVNTICTKYVRDFEYPTTGYDAYSTTWSAWSTYKPIHRTPAERLRQIIQNRQAPTIIGSRKFIGVPENSKEVRARETLLRVLGAEKYRGFLRNGFVSVRGKSGKVYQIFPGHGITKVYQYGQLVDRLCVVLRGSFPPTDAIIMRFLLILNDEAEFYRLAIKHSIHQSTPVTRQVDLRPLPEIYRGLAAAA